MKKRMTKKEAKEMVKRIGYDVYGPGYCSEQEYCRKVGIAKSDLVVMGSNSGVYGWNWTLYLDNVNDNIIISGYRNAPILAYKDLKELSLGDN